MLELGRDAGFVALITPMKRGLKGLYSIPRIEIALHVALITPMKRGLKVTVALLLATKYTAVALITPMKRGLKASRRRGQIPHKHPLH